MPATKPKPAQAFQSLPGYRLVRLIAKGGMGEVYEAEEAASGRRVAVKVVAASLLADPKSRDRFRLEARILGKLRNPNIVGVHALGSHGDLNFIVMELVDGEPLSTILTHGRLEVPTAMLWLQGILNGLGGVHDAGLIHRDIKPENLIVKDDDTVKIADFGLVTFDNVDRPRLTATGLVLGTVDFLAPELIAGERASVRSDLYAVGVVLYEMLTGQPAFADPNPLLKLKAIRENELPSLLERRPDLPEPLVAIAMRLCHKDPAARYGSVGEVDAALRTAGLFPPAVTPGTAPRPRPAVTGEVEIKERLSGLGFNARDTEAILLRAVGIEEKRAPGRPTSGVARKLFDLSGDALDAAIAAQRQRQGVASPAATPARSSGRTRSPVPLFFLGGAALAAAALLVLLIRRLISG